MKDQIGRKMEVIVDFWDSFVWLPNIHEYLCPSQLLLKRVQVQHEY
jgi:hypothetical protein